MNRVLIFTLCCLCLLGMAPPCAAQSQDSLAQMIRFYEDDDFINIWFKGSDDAYTNGTRIDYFYKPAHPSHLFLDSWMPRAGAGSTDIYGWGAMQIMYTPDDISDADYQPNDYPWSGALIATHTRYSYNPEKQYDLQTELVLGVIGPAALSRQTQTLVHRVENYYKPMGWEHQFSNDLLLNVNVTAEKQLASIGSAIQIIGCGQLFAGTMQNGAALYPMIIIGRMNPYFQGLFSQFASPGRKNGRRQSQLYFFAKPELQWYLSNALLQGGPFTTNPNLAVTKAKTAAASTAQDTTNTSPPQPYHLLQTWVPSFTYGVNASMGHWGISFSQIISAATLRGLYCHNYGNLSLYYSW
ncbi:MAG TPA: lipid A deacylase LpxR family protein [Puia sp.]|nr:lipid A deacylase LpxR family protein [Puia sp.]